ncbi:SSU ribosomal protein S30P /sigma 54 modulation protein [Acidocella aminolytica 101 = DSM 11237]|jgi:ribosomal subunit interface protein|uniref:Ribosome hibernation promoting factor n=2 Tax=Acidocella TaxID=50709 RepID=A0A0D6PA73_9PROT|nr:30S ribosomal protein S30 [Acidocella aminolytica 101 = DSM 11237]GBQ36764.1 30S ribosomal protein S30 [Acidocella aminolytica 101 = DSM 11237]SHE43902.1 SSU ribosomal protein S30P /sigma 54 modulation protein [Acidocella aminolytica 101 = DSM 11237]
MEWLDPTDKVSRFVREKTMQLTVSGKQVELSDALRVHVDTQLGNITAKYFDHALEAQVTFGRARSFFTCDINLHAGRGITVRGEGEAADARTAFEDAAEHIAKRLRRYRRRVSAHQRDLNKIKPEMARAYILAPESEEEEHATPNGVDTATQEFHATVIAEDMTAIETLTVRDAVMKMDLAFQPVKMFRNSKTGGLNVVYRRTDGHVGWIDPEA